MAFQIDYAYISHTGKVRLNNEDNFWCCGDYMPADNKGTSHVISGCKPASHFPVMAVFDGMGGESYGEMASHLSAVVCDKWYNTRKRELQKKTEEYLNNLCKDMNSAVCAYAEENKIQSMGSTASIIAFTEQEAYICNLGDSPVLESEGGVLQQLSVDHILRGTLFGKPPLTQFVGIPEDYMTIEPSISRINLVPGARFLVCSDGVTDMIPKTELGRLLSMNEACEQIVDSIWKCAMEKGGRDNITMILCQVSEKKTSTSAFSTILSRLRKGQGTEIDGKK